MKDLRSQRKEFGLRELWNMGQDTIRLAPQEELCGASEVRGAAARLRLGSQEAD